MRKADYPKRKGRWLSSFSVCTLASIALALICNSKTEAFKAPQGQIIPSPSIKLTEDLEMSAGKKLSLEGEGFITNFPDAHYLYLKRLEKADLNSKPSPQERINRQNGKNRKNRNKSRKKKTKYRKLAISNVEEGKLETFIPRSLAYGDYEFLLRLKTRFLKSRLNKPREKLLIRPVAPREPELKLKALSKENRAKELLVTADRIYELELDLEIGKSKLKTYYHEDGYKSIRSTAVDFYYLPSEVFQSPLELRSEDPLIAYARSLNGEEIDVSEIVEKEELDLSRSYFLVTPSHSRYLESTIKLKPIFIAKLHVKSPEFAILENRSQTDFSLAGCILSDSIKERFSFGEDAILEAKSTLKIEANLGLNDASADELSLKCPQKETNSESSQEIEQELELIDKLRYSKLDEDGFAIKD